MVSHSDNDGFLVVNDLRKYFSIGRRLLKSNPVMVKAIDGITFTLKKGGVLGIVGESGCGKTTAGRSILRLIEPSGGTVFFDGHNVLQATPKEMKALRRRMQFMFQDPYSSLDPRMSLYRIVKEPLDNFFGHMSRSKKKELVATALSQVGLQADQMTRFPHEFSGGQRQRIALARTLISNPELIICDEPVSALDVSIQAQVINLLKRLRKELDLTLIFISHDLAVVEHLCDRIAVMYLGQIIELAPKHELYQNPVHPYTRSLLSAVPIPDPQSERAKKREVLSGEVPSPINVPQGCYFHTRCQYMTDECKQTRQELVSINQHHSVACHLESHKRKSSIHH